MTKIFFLGVLVAAAAWPAAAQQSPAAGRVVAALPTRLEDPKCELKPGHFKVGSGKTYLNSALGTSVPENRSRLLNDGERVLNEAIKDNGQGKNPAAWYYLGRIHLQRGDLAGADSAFARTLALRPDCGEEVRRFRVGVWSALMNAGQEFTKAGNGDSAAVMFREAARIHPSAPDPYYRLGFIYNDRGQPDSAIHYLRLAVDAAGETRDSNVVKVRNSAAYNLGALLINQKRYQEAVQVFERYVAWEPNDPQAKRGLATAYRQTDQTEKAQKLEAELAASAGAAGPAEGGISGSDLAQLGVNLFRDKKYKEAAEAFRKALEQNPYDRDLLYNLANTYYELKDGANLVTVGRRLHELDPMNETVLRLLGQGYVLTQDMNKAGDLATQLEALPFGVKVNAFNVTAGGANLAATATGRKQTKAPVTLTFEFLTAEGQVVATRDVTVEPPAPGATTDLSVEAQGSGIAAWRYRRK
ncbi:MAG TPA: tetratricopeptide repeat protein [Gemmatimonadales bacterium]|nr:tetratricopeptide repeat protein [Gemmatimonadales bacterium]